MGGRKSKFRTGGPGSTDDVINFIMDATGTAPEEMAKLQKVYQKFDLGKDGEVQYDEFCARLRCEPTELLRSLFSFFASPGEERHKNPSLKFGEFCLFVLHFLTLGEKALVEFLFIVLTCDKEDRSPMANVPLHILEGNIREILNTTDHHKLSVFLNKMSEKEHGKLYISRKHFVDSVITHNKSIAFPVVAYQLDMTRKVVGKKFWARKENKAHRSILTLRYQLNELIESETAGDNNIDGNDIELETG